MRCFKGCSAYHSVAASGAVSGSSCQRGSFPSKAFSGASQSMSTNGSKLRRVVARESVSTLSTNGSSVMPSPSPTAVISPSRSYARQEPNSGGVFMAMKCSHRHRPVGVQTTGVSRVGLVTQTAPFDIADGNALPRNGETNAETLLPDDFVGRLVGPQSPPARLAKSVVGRAFAVTDFADQLRSDERDALGILSGKPGVEG